VSSDLAIGNRFSSLTPEVRISGISLQAQHGEDVPRG
jgi:hypothetical protein